MGWGVLECRWVSCETARLMWWCETTPREWESWWWMGRRQNSGRGDQVALVFMFLKLHGPSRNVPASANRAARSYLLEVDRRRMHSLGRYKMQRTCPRPALVLPSSLNGPSDPAVEQEHRISDGKCNFDRLTATPSCHAGTKALTLLAHIGEQDDYLRIRLPDTYTEHSRRHGNPISLAATAVQTTPAGTPPDRQRSPSEAALWRASSIYVGRFPASSLQLGGSGLLTTTAAWLTLAPEDIVRTNPLDALHSLVRSSAVRTTRDTGRQPAHRRCVAQPQNLARVHDKAISLPVSARRRLPARSALRYQASDLRCFWS